MKKIFALVLAILMIFSLSSAKEDENMSEADKRFLEYPYDLNEYISFADPTCVKAEFDDPGVCTEEEIDNALFQIMLTYAEFTPVEGRHAEMYDKVIVDYVGSLNGEVIDDLIATDYEIILGLDGNNDISVVLQNQLIGKTVGDSVLADYTYPDNPLYYGDYAGQKVSFSATVKSVMNHNVPNCTDEFVKDLEGYDFETVDDFRKSLKTDIMEQKEKDKINDVWDAFYETVVVKKYPEKELKAYYDSYIDYYVEDAKEYNLSTEEYLKEYLDIDDIQLLYDEAKEYSEYMCKNDMIFILLSQKLGVEITEEEFDAGIDEYYQTEAENYNSVEEFINYYGEKNLRRNVQWDKALVKMVSTAINTK